MELTQKQLGPFRIQQKMGSDGLIEFYAATDTRVSQDVILYILDIALQPEPAFADRFLRRAQEAMQLRHPNLIGIREAGRLDGYVYIASEQVVGISLAAYLAQRAEPLPIDEATAIIEQLATALDHAHARGFLHLGITPKEIYLTHDGKVRLAGVGMLRRGEHDRGQLLNISVGTAPEQVRDDLQVDQRADVYGLGTIAYTMFVGRPPFDELSSAALADLIVHRPPLAPETQNPRLPAGIASVLKFVLSKEPNLRYGTASEFAAALNQAQQWASNPRFAAAAEPTAGRAAKPTAQRSTRGLLAAAALLLLVLIAGVMLARGSLRRAFTGVEGDATLIAIATPLETADENTPTGTPVVLASSDTSENGIVNDSGDSTETTGVVDAGQTITMEVVLSTDTVFPPDIETATAPAANAEVTPTVELILVPTDTPLPTAAPTDTNTAVPPTATETAMPTDTNTAVPPTATETAVPTNTNTAVPPTATATAIPPTATETAVPTNTNTAVPPTATETAVPTNTNTAVPPTATKTAVPTNTNTAVPPTATETAVPTNTNTAVPPTATATAVPPTATETAVPPTATNTNTPVPPPTNTRQPTATRRATNTRVPTSTNTVVPPTATNTPLPTATDTPLPTPTNTPEPPVVFAAAVTPQPTGGIAQVSGTGQPGGLVEILINNRVAATAPVGENGIWTSSFRLTQPGQYRLSVRGVLDNGVFTAVTASVVVAVPTATPAPTPIPLPTPTPTVGEFTLGVPEDGASGSGNTLFSWNTTFVPGPNQGFEVVFWRDGQDPLVNGFGLASPVTGNSITVPLNVVDANPGHPLNPGPYRWGVLLVQISPYQRLQFMGSSHSFNYYNDNGGGGGGGGGNGGSSGEGGGGSSGE